MVLATWDCYRNKTTQWDSIIFQYANTIRRIQRQNWLLHNLSHFLFKHICFNTMRQKNRITKCRWKLLLYIFLTYLPIVFPTGLVIFITSHSIISSHLSFLFNQIHDGRGHKVTIMTQLLSLLWADLKVNCFICF